jgi:hypothetical protein
MDDENCNVHDDYDDCDIMVMVMMLTMMMTMFTMSNMRIAIIMMLKFNYELVRYS